MTIIDTLIAKNVIIPAPQAVVIENVTPDRIEPGSIIYPGSVIRGEETFIGANSSIGAAGGAFIENCQIGRGCTLMQGAYRDSTMLDGFNARNGAEIRDNCLLEECSSLGHTVGLKQTFFFPNVVAGSLINFCDALLTGGKSRKDHSEIGSCMALYNFTPQGDKFASRFGDVARGVFLNQNAIFIGGQTQIVSPVLVGYGSVIAAGSKLGHNVECGRLICGDASKPRDIENDAVRIHRPEQKVLNTLQYIEDLVRLKFWYESVRIPALHGISAYDAILPFAIKRIDAAIAERKKRLASFAKHIEASRALTLAPESALEHDRALLLASRLEIRVNKGDARCAALVEALKSRLSQTPDYIEAVQSLDDALKTPDWTN